MALYGINVTPKGGFYPNVFGLRTPAYLHMGIVYTLRVDMNLLGI